MLNQGHDSVQNLLRVEGNSTYLNQMLEGILPEVGSFTPSGEGPGTSTCWRARPSWSTRTR